MKKLCIEKGGIMFKSIPRMGVCVVDGRIIVQDVRISKAAANKVLAEGGEWKTINGAKVLLNANGEQVAGHEIDGGSSSKKSSGRGSKGAHLRPLKDGEAVPKEVEERIGKKVPPKWTNVEVSDDPEAELQVRGIDSAGRHQSLYLPEHYENSSEKKWDRVGKANREEVDNAIAKARKDNPDTGDCLFLMRETGLRPGSNRDTKAKEQAYGATTLLGKHVVIDGDNVSLQFTGKDNVKQNLPMTNPEVKRILIERKNAAGNDGKLFNTNGRKLSKALPDGVIPKDLRTMRAIDDAKKYVKEYQPAKTVKELNKIRNAVADKVCKTLGNGRSMSLNSYIDPQVFRDHSPKAMKQYEAEQEAKKQAKRGGKK